MNIRNRHLKPQNQLKLLLIKKLTLILVIINKKRLYQ